MESRTRTSVGSRIGKSKYRTSLALDRTTLAWIRTALTLATFGFGIIGFFRTMVQTTHTEEAMRLHRGSIRMGIVLAVTGIVATLLAAGSHKRALRALQRGERLSLSRLPLALTLAVLIAVLGVCGLWSVFAE